MISSLRDTIQAKLFALYTRRLTKAAKKSAINHQHSIPARIGLLYTHDPGNPEKTDAVVHVVKKLQADGKQVQVLCYLSDNKAIETNIPFDTVTKKDINLLGGSQNKPLNSFLKSPVAYLYHLDLVSDAVLDYVVAKCIANCKIGNYLAGREALFELMFKDLVHPEGEVSFDNLISKMFSYTQLLKV
jgi:hypothetical protein